MTASKLAQGQSILGLTGTYKGLGNAGTGDVRRGKTFSTASLSNVTGTMAEQAGKTITPSESAQVAIPANTFAAGAVNVAAISKTHVGSGIARQGAKTITAGTGNVSAGVSGKYMTGEITVAPTPTQSKTVTPSSSQQTIRPDAGKHLSQVIVNGVPSNYVPIGGWAAFRNGVKLGPIGLAPNIYREVLGSLGGGWKTFGYIERTNGTHNGTYDFTKRSTYLLDRWIPWNNLKSVTVTFSSERNKLAGGGIFLVYNSKDQVDYGSRDIGWSAIGKCGIGYDTGNIDANGGTRTFTMNVENPGVAVSLDKVNIAINGYYDLVVKELIINFK